ncbi:MAG: BolA family protein [Candidatus Sericytochromatia bacterium]
MSNFERVQETVKSNLSDAKVEIYDLGGGNHLRIEIESKDFEGKTLIQQHKLVHEILDHEMESRGGFIHALSIKTSIPKN